MAIKVNGTTAIDDSLVFLPNSIASKVASPTISTNTLTIDLNTGSVFSVSLDSNITTLTMTNIQATRVSSVVLMLSNPDGVARAVTWPASFRWAQGTAPTLTPTVNKVDVFVFYTTNGGTTWSAFIAGQNFSV